MKLLARRFRFLILIASNAGVLACSDGDAQRDVPCVAGNICDDGDLCTTHDTCQHGGACVGEPLPCDKAAAPTCKDTEILLVSVSPGRCDGGSCVYSEVEVTCPVGCIEDDCIGDACAGVTCNEPPDHECSSAKTVRTFVAPGGCSHGVCIYPFDDTYCPQGCNNGACVDDPCAGVTCSGHGACASTNTGISCLCDFGWTGASCDACDSASGFHPDGSGGCTSDFCMPNPCQESNRGVCVDNGAGPVCLCDIGYHDEAGVCVEDGDDVFRNISQNTDTPRVLKKFEMTFDLTNTYDNPYDFEEIEVAGEFIDPLGQTHEAGGFWFEGFQIVQSRIEPTGENHWKIRFAPWQAGTWSYRLKATDASGTHFSSWREFTALAAESDENGFIKVDPDDRHYFYYSFSGKTFFGVGANLDINAFYNVAAADQNHVNWGTDSLYMPSWTQVGADQQITDETSFAGWSEYRNMIDAIGNHGGNFVRIHLDRYWHPIEADPDVTPPLGASTFGDLGFDLGRYHQRMCYMADLMFEQCELYDIGVVLNQWAHMGNDWGAWKYAEPDLTTFEENLVKRRLRYVHARWGYSTSFMVLEYFNETGINSSIVQSYTPITSWVEDLDPYGHLVSYGCEWPEYGGGPNLTSGPQIIDRHVYQPDHSSSVWKGDEGHLTYAEIMPFYLGETGVNRKGSDPVNNWDPSGNFPRMTFFGALVNGKAGVLSWWFRTAYGERGGNLYEQIFPGISGFLQGENLGDEGPWQHLTCQVYADDLKYNRLIANHDKTKAFLFSVRAGADVIDDQQAVSGRWVKAPLATGHNYLAKWYDTVTGALLSTVDCDWDGPYVVINIPGNVTRDRIAKIVVDDIPGIVIDNAGAFFQGEWVYSTTSPGWYGADYRSRNALDGYARYTPNIVTAGNYRVYIWHPNATVAASNLQVTVHHSVGDTAYVVDQNSGGGGWKILGEHHFATGALGYAEINCAGTNGWALADAFRFEPTQ